MADPVVMAVVTAVSAKGAEALAAGARSAWSALVRLVKDRLTREPDGPAALNAALAAPGQHPARQQLIAVLSRVMDTDPGFAQQLRTAWSDAAAVSADHGGVVNHMSGHAQKVVQTRDVFGNVSL